MISVKLMGPVKTIASKKRFIDARRAFVFSGFKKMDARMKEGQIFPKYLISFRLNAHSPEPKNI